MTEMLAVIQAEIRRRQRPGAPFLAAIDGRCGAGKSTLAAALQKPLHANIIPLDHFFLPAAERPPAHRDKPGGNIDQDRFLAEVLVPLQQHLAVSYRPYDCARQAFGAVRSLPPADLTIIDGSYSCHPHFRRYYDLTIFLTISRSEQLHRLAHREGPDRLEAFRQQWIPREEQYFSALTIADHCDLCFDTTLTRL